MVCAEKLKNTQLSPPILMSLSMTNSSDRQTNNDDFGNDDEMTKKKLLIHFYESCIF